MAESPRETSSSHSLEARVWLRRDFSSRQDRVHRSSLNKHPSMLSASRVRSEDNPERPLSCISRCECLPGTFLSRSGSASLDPVDTETTTGDTRHLRRTRNHREQKDYSETEPFWLRWCSSRAFSPGRILRLLSAAWRFCSGLSAPAASSCSPPNMASTHWPLGWWPS